MKFLACLDFTWPLAARDRATDTPDFWQCMCTKKKKKKLDQELNEVALWDIQIYSEMLAGYYCSNVITVVVVSKLKIIRWVLLLFKLP